MSGRKAIVSNELQGHEHDAFIHDQVINHQLSVLARPRAVPSMKYTRPKIQLVVSPRHVMSLRMCEVGIMWR